MRDALADLHLTAGDDAVDRRADDRAFDVELSGIELGFGGDDAGIGIFGEAVDQGLIGREVPAGGGLFGTASDYLRFLNMVLEGGAGVLKPETVALMRRDQLNGVPMRNLKTAAPFLTHDIGIWGDAPMHWGLTWMINPAPGPHGRRPGSLAWAGLANTYYWADPETGVAAVIMTQLLPFADPDCLALFNAYERAIYAAID